MVYNWTDVLFFCTWKVWFMISLFLIYCLLPLASIGLVYLSIRKYRRIALGDGTLAATLFIGWAYALALLHNMSPTMMVSTYTSLSGIKTHSMITSVKNSLSDSFADYVKYEQSHARPLPPIRRVIGTEVRASELLSWKEPIHVFVDVKDVKTGLVMKDLYVSKYCTSAYQLRVHDIYHAKVNVVMYDEKTVYEFLDLPATFCSR
mgnify:CR=1 FL=1